MINLREGKITLGVDTITVASSYDELTRLAKQGLIEKREDASGEYYYVATEADSMRFDVFISLQNKKIEWILLRWLDRPMKSWDDVSEKAMTDEYRLLSNLVKNQVGAPPDNIRTGTRTWRLKWGQLNVSYEVRSFDVAIFMKPR